MLCRDLTLVKHEPGSIRISPLYCRAWTCDICAPKRQAQLIRTAQEGKPDTLITITVNPAFGESPAHRAALLADAWRAFRRKHTREHPTDPLPFLAVFERTQLGEPHLHIIARVRWIPQAELARFMGERIAAPVCDIRRVRSVRGVARYVAKYVAKDPARFGTCKRYWNTPGWSSWRAHHRQDLRERGTRFQVSRQTVWEYLKEATLNGFLAEEDGDGFVLRYCPRERGPPSRARALYPRANQQESALRARPCQ